MEQFEVEIEMGSPMALGAMGCGPTLDSVLLALLSERDGSDEEGLLRALDKVLRITAGLPAASSLWPTGEPVWGRAAHPRVASVDEVGAWQDHKGSSYERKKDFVRGQWKTDMADFATVYFPVWSWWGCGDSDAVANLLEGLSSVGAKRGIGYGFIARVSVRGEASVSVHEEEAQWRVQDVKGGLRLGRPVPMDQLESFLAAAGATRDELVAERHMVVPLPRWPQPAWGGAADPAPTMVPLL